MARCGSILQHKVTPFDMSRWPEPLDVTRDTPGVLLKKEQVIKRSRFNQEEVIGISKGGKAVCAKNNIREATYYGWKRKFGDMDVSQSAAARRREPGTLRLSS